MLMVKWEVRRIDGMASMYVVEIKDYIRSVKAILKAAGLLDITGTYNYSMDGRGGRMNIIRLWDNGYHESDDKPDYILKRITDF